MIKWLRRIAARLRARSDREDFREESADARDRNLPPPPPSSFGA